MPAKVTAQKLNNYCTCPALPCPGEAVLSGPGPGPGVLGCAVLGRVRSRRLAATWCKLIVSEAVASWADFQTR